MIKDVLEEMSVVDFLAVRFAIAAVFLAVALGHVLVG